MLKDTLLIGQEKFLLLVKSKIQYRGLISHLNGEEINQEELRIEKLIKIKADKLYVKWKGYNNSFNSWINKKCIV